LRVLVKHIDQNGGLIRDHCLPLRVGPSNIFSMLGIRLSVRLVTVCLTRLRQQDQRSRICSL
jgi:hypothetical protein